MSCRARCGQSLEHHCCILSGDSRICLAFYGEDGWKPRECIHGCQDRRLKFPQHPQYIGFPGSISLCDSIGKRYSLWPVRSPSSQSGEWTASAWGRRPSQEISTEVVTRAVKHPLAKLYPWVAGRFAGHIICLKGGDVRCREIDSSVRNTASGAGSVRKWRISNGLKVIISQKNL